MSQIFVSTCIRKATLVVLSFFFLNWIFAIGLRHYCGEICLGTSWKLWGILWRWWSCFESTFYFYSTYRQKNKCMDIHKKIVLCPFLQLLEGCFKYLDKKTFFLIFFMNFFAKIFLKNSFKYASLTYSSAIHKSLIV